MMVIVDMVEVEDVVMEIIVELDVMVEMVVVIKEMVDRHPMLDGGLVDNLMLTVANFFVLTVEDTDKLGKTVGT